MIVFDRFELMAWVAAGVIGLAFAAGALYARVRTRRHLNRLRTVPLDTWADRG